MPLTGDHYSDFPAGSMRVVGSWTTDARDTGYYVTISDDHGIHVRGSVGTSCRVPESVPLKVGAEDSWVTELVAARSDKVAGGFKTCVRGVAKKKKA